MGMLVDEPSILPTEHIFAGSQGMEQRRLGRDGQAVAARVDLRS
jgi:hypothetical protein